MPARLRLFILFGALLATQGASDAQRANPIRRAGHGRVPNRYLVSVKADFDPEALGLEAANLRGGRLKHVYRRALRGFAIRLSEAQAAALAADPRVEYVAEDVEVRASATVATSAWNLDRIDQRDRPYDNSYTYLDDGTGVNVYVVDSGVRTSHDEFGGRAFFGGEFTDDDLDADPNDIRNDDADPSTLDGADCNGHGTHVAGIVGGRTYGVAKNVTIWSYRVLRCVGSGQATDVVAALDAIIADHRSPAVVNLSLGGLGFTPLEDAVRAAMAEGITVVVAAGNDGATITNQTPATVPEAIVVGATTVDDQRAPYSNYGPLVDLFAPGDNVPSAWYTGDSAEMYLSGTSMAAPHVAGAAALYLQTHPYASPAEVRDALVAQATTNHLTDPGSGSPNLLLFSAFQAPATPAVDVPAALAFASQRVGTVSGARSLQITNHGGAALSVSRVTIGGTARADFRLTSDGCTGKSVAAGNSCVVQVAFAPTGGGARDASLTIVSNAHDSPAIVAVSGTGVYDNGTYIPAPWTSVDIGATGASGGAWFADNAFTISGAGSDIWGSADAFQFTYQPLSGDGTIVARIAALTGPDPWTKAGVMIRQTLDAESAHAMMLVSVAKGVAYQRRTTAGGSTLNTSGGTGSAPAWVKLARVGQVITASVSADGSSWTVVGSNTFTMPGTVFVGLAITSHSTTSVGSARFERVGVSTAGMTTTGLPSGWSSADVGSTGRAGSAVESGGTFTVTGAGADIWGTADAFHFVYRSLAGDGTITARIASLNGAQAWAKAGVMIRASLSPGAAHGLMLVSVAKGVAFQRRVATSGVTTSTSGGSGAAPRWVRLKRQGQNVSASVSVDGSTWTTVGEDTFALGSTVLVGLATTSHDVSSVATSAFDQVSVSAPAGALPTGWAAQDVGSTGVRGSSTTSSATFTVRGAGADVWGTADAFQFAYRSLNGDGAITARVASLAGTQAWTKAGVMIRASLSSDSAHALMLVSAGKGTAFQRRTTTGGVSTSTTGPAGTAPRWVRLTRSGQVISAYVSDDGTAWTLVGQDTFSMGATTWVGLAVTSHDTTQLATATFDQVK